MLCCDNMTGNGAKLRAACVALAREQDVALADWIADEVAFPDSMVDSITPASDAAFLGKVRDALGVEDLAAVQRESFTQWVLQRFDMADGPDLASAGATLTDDVRGYEQAKLRILNGAHSTLAYVGLARGHETVFEAMSDAALEGFVARLVHQDIAASLAPVEGLDKAAYADAVLNRFRNPEIRHLLAQIAWDGSQKLPIACSIPRAQRSMPGVASNGWRCRWRRGSRSCAARPRQARRSPIRSPTHSPPLRPVPIR
ncbi:mannitol dehydrogenase family protein [Sphingomonas sp. 7/4-4]|uniref:mannitol dehydrogenase family protein n=1 Tax=Sphingomonas sp. 7/4-4 TaxID=3018446 RepID=UPI0022F37EFC|nr:mannitol dehydrogenase family protein [Sphingomonas sp. 7/4-4]WBY07216.1 mannitol dehydrogenase family protein [Sphingomonas sp. 7/4-4]